MGRRVPFKDSGKHFKTVFLTDEQVSDIVEKYPFTLNTELCDEYGVSKDLICNIGRHYSLKKDKDWYATKKGWNTNDEPVDLVMFDWFYPKLTDAHLREIFGKSDHFIRRLAKERGLLKCEETISARQSKSKPRIKYNTSGKHYESDEISLNDTLYVVENYYRLSNRELVEKIGCREGVIVSIANYYELSKDKDIVEQRKKQILSYRNKSMGRDLTPEVLKEIALKYHSKREFQYKDSSAYTTANRLGIMDEITSHMVNISFSIPQIITRQITEYLFKQNCQYNTRKIIAPYELDIYFPDLKIAFEYDGKGWHKDDAVDKHVLCINLDIHLLTISERHRKYEEDIKTQLIENLEKINDWCKTDITEQDVLSFNEPIDFPKLFTEEELYILRNNTVTFLRKNYDNLYQKYRRYNPDNIDFKKSHNGRRIWDEEQVIATINKYTSKSELLNNDSACYQVIHKKYRHLLPLYTK